MIRRVACSPCVAADMGNAQGATVIERLTEDAFTFGRRADSGLYLGRNAEVINCSICSPSWSRMPSAP